MPNFTTPHYNASLIVILLVFGIGLPVTWAQKGNRRFPYCSHKSSVLEFTDPGNARSDTMDILHIDIELDMSLVGSQQIKAVTTLDLLGILTTDTIHLDLHALTVDSVKVNGVLSPFNHAGDHLYIVPGYNISPNELAQTQVFYHGHPETDGTWGGFYFNLGYAFNLGVGFESDPHNFGRAWFPCFDNFVERSTYDIHVLTTGNRKSYCGGLLSVIDTIGTDSIISNWELNTRIPSYLASIAVVDYTRVEQSFESITGETIPIWLAAKAADTTDFKNSLVNLIPTLDGFEEKYGPYNWERVGYVAVPFNGGAMEHATNIAYPIFAINGNLAYETLYAHELSHHWWGDWVTCKTAEDMWINEGWASFSEALFQELIYGQEAYIDYVKTNHKDVLLNTHEDDGGYYAVSGIPHELTYGSHVYLKGADVTHTLRGYMGDEAFFSAIQSVMEVFGDSVISSEDLRDLFQTYTASDLNAFFDNWIWAPGFPEFRTTEINAVPQNNQWLTEVDIVQFSHFAPELYSNVPLQITVMDANYASWDTTLIVSEAFTQHSFLSPVEPVHVILNRDQRLNYAVLAEEKWLTETGSNDFDFAEMEVDVNAMGEADSLWIRIENHFATAENNPFIPFTDWYISTDRWWKVIGNHMAGMNLDATIAFYGNSGAVNYYDQTYFQYLDDNGFSENDLVLLYRQSPEEAWTQWPSFSINTSGSSTNFAGKINIDGLIPGEYAWAIHTGVVNADEISNTSNWTVNYSNQKVFIAEYTGLVYVFDTNGKFIFSGLCEDQLQIDVSGWANGNYIVKGFNSTYTFVK